MAASMKTLVVMEEAHDEHARLLVDLVNPRLVRLKRAACVAAGIIVLQSIAFAAGAVYYRRASMHIESMIMDTEDARKFGDSGSDRELCGTFTEGSNILAGIVESMPPIKLCTSRTSDTCEGGAELVTALAYESSSFDVGQDVEALRGDDSSWEWYNGTVLHAFSNHTYTVKWRDGEEPLRRWPSQMRAAGTKTNQAQSQKYSHEITFRQGYQRALSLWAPRLLGRNETLRSPREDLETLRGIYIKLLRYSKEARWNNTPDEKTISLTMRGSISKGFCFAYDDWGRSVVEVFDSEKEAVAFAGEVSGRFMHIIVDLSSNKTSHSHGGMGKMDSHKTEKLTKACYLRTQIWALGFAKEARHWLKKLQKRKNKLGRTWPCQLGSRKCHTYDCFRQAHISCVSDHKCSDSVVSVHKAVRRSWISCFLDSAQLISNYEVAATSVIMLFYMFFTRGVSWCNAAELSDFATLASESATKAEVEALHQEAVQQEARRQGQTLGTL
eukprot:TRINITY_DN2354_c0_g1_i1.p1 TRINITY_DN2354_c0_g1~~TRINITY_DN2354_c0_g1_i1.p1  ORF type:complete len:526 (-),score=71.22 TRINITY_DN2354_c0_g1_i1:391-1884(-)